MGLWDRVRRWFGADSASDQPTDDEAPPDERRVPQPIARDLALEAAIAADRDLIAPYLVYADWLQQHDDPRGELIALQVALGETTNAAKLVELRARERELFREHKAYLLGPVSDGDPKWRYGFIERLEWEHAWVQSLIEILEVDHPATRFLDEIGVYYCSEEDLARVRAAAGADRTVRLRKAKPVLSLEAELKCSERGDEIVVDVAVDSADLSMYANHAYLVSTTVASDITTTTWWFGGCDDLIGTLSAFAAGAYPVPRWSGNAKVTIALRVRVPETMLWFRGEVTLEAGIAGCFVMLHPWTPIESGCFTHATITEVTPVHGPTLVDGGDGDDGDFNVNWYGAALPDLGVVFGMANRLLTRDGWVQLRDLRPSEQLYLGSSYGGPRGALAEIHHRHEGYGDVLTLVRLPDGEPRHIELLGNVRACAFDPSGGELAAVSFGPKTIAIYDVDGGRELVSLPLGDNFDALPSVCWYQGDVHVAFSGRAWRVDREARRLVPSEIPLAVACSVQHHGLGAPSFHPHSGRTAWMIGASTPEEALDDPTGTSLIAWRDRGGGHGTVAIPDDGTVDRAHRGNAIVLEDGRILALGTRVWLVDPETMTVSDLGDAGNYSTPPVITRHRGTLRLWSHGAGPWWIEL